MHTSYPSSLFLVLNCTTDNRHNRSQHNMPGHGRHQVLWITISYLANIVVAGTLGTLLFLNRSKRVVRAFGPNTSSRQILSCLYLSIAILSGVGLLRRDYFLAIAPVLFPMQIVYKLLTLVAVKDRKNPVPYANLVISVLHLFSLWQLK
jgi:hypothetical protein